MKPTSNLKDCLNDFLNQDQVRLMSCLNQPPKDLDLRVHFDEHITFKEGTEQFRIAYQKALRNIHRKKEEWMSKGNVNLLCDKAESYVTPDIENDTLKLVVHAYFHESTRA